MCPSYESNSLIELKNYIEQSSWFWSWFFQSNSEQYTVEPHCMWCSPHEVQSKTTIQSSFQRARWLIVSHHYLVRRRHPRWCSGASSASLKPQSCHPHSGSPMKHPHASHPQDSAIISICNTKLKFCLSLSSPEPETGFITKSGPHAEKLKNGSFQNK